MTVLLATVLFGTALIATVLFATALGNRRGAQSTLLDSRDAAPAWELP